MHVKHCRKDVQGRGREKEFGDQMLLDSLEQSGPRDAQLVEEVESLQSTTSVQGGESVRVRLWPETQSSRF